MSDWLIALILGFIEGLTEFIPVSSTGHLLIAEHWIPRQSDLYNVVIQCGAVLAVLPLFSERLRMLSKWREPTSRDLLLKIFVAFALTAIGGKILDSRNFKLPETVAPVAWALCIGGLLFIVAEWWLKGRTPSDKFTWTVTIAVAVAQLVAAVFPGTSRSGATIVVALLLGISRVAATEFSFLVGIPTLLAAGAWKIFKALHHADAGAPAENWAMLALGTIVAAVVSFIAVKWLLRFVQSHTFVGFGIYRIALAVLLLLFLRESSPIGP
jgi:undecaprenyl-diphosphatase